MEILPTHRRASGRRSTCSRSGCAPAHVVPLLADRDLSARGVEVEFFGGRTRMPAGPALLALRTGAPLYVVALWYEPDAAARRRVAGPLPMPGPRRARWTSGSRR